MSTHKYIDRICVAVILFAVLITAIFMNGESLGVLAVSGGAGYANRLFDSSQVHTIDIVMEDWEEFIANCENEEYVQCTVVIDGEDCRNVGIRAKGNTSLSNVSAMGSDRYSFKIEFDHYDSTKSYFGLDKLSLNNLIQDTTYMKDYLTYRMMGNFGVDAPLCSYAYITVNGEDWGLYLAVEGVEEAFLQRNYGNDYGNLYKPDSTDFGGGPGNGRDFHMDDFMETPGEEDKRERPKADGMQNEKFPEAGEFGGFGEPPREKGAFETGEGGPQMFFGGKGSSDVKLQYIDDNPDSYPNIFDNAKTDVGEGDKVRLISSLKSLSEGDRIEKIVDVEEVLRYFVVHNFVCNGDSYTGSIVHNYYLYEEDGQLSMIPWDYNLAFGTFQASDATSMVNSPIDSPVTDSPMAGGKGNFGFPGADAQNPRIETTIENAQNPRTETTIENAQNPRTETIIENAQNPRIETSIENEESRPMVDWIFADEAYTEQYHQYFAEFLESMDFEEMIDTAAELIAPYVKKDLTKFYSYEEFETGVAVLKEFCALRKESVERQLLGSIPSTSFGQREGNSVMVDASHLRLSDMGTMENGKRA